MENKCTHCKMMSIWKINIMCKKIQMENKSKSTRCKMGSIWKISGKKIKIENKSTRCKMGQYGK